MGRNKYNAVKCECDGIKFDSKKEMKRYNELKLLEKAGVICCIEVHPRYTLIEKNEHFRKCEYIADFRYMICKTKETIVEDVKGGKATRTPVYMLKKKLMYEKYGILISEV